MKKSRFSGRAEVWFNEDRNIVVLRDSQFLFWAMNLNEKNTARWELHAFKKEYTFDFVNGTSYLYKNNFKLVEKL